MYAHKWQEKEVNQTSLKSSSRRCCLRRSICLTATLRPVLRSTAVHTIPVDPSPIFRKLSSTRRGSPGLTTDSIALRNWSTTQHVIINWSVNTHTHTHTYPFNGPFPGLPRWADTRKVKPIWILLKQETVSGSGISRAICKSAPCSRQIITPAPHYSVFYRPDALSATQPTTSKHWRHFGQ